MNTQTILFAVAAAMVALLWAPVRQRLALSRAKHRSMAGHARIGRWLSTLIPFYDYDEAQFFGADGAPDSIAQQRRDGFSNLAALYAQRFAKTARATSDVQPAIPDLQFTSRYRVPFQFSRVVRQNFGAGSFLQSSSGPVTTDLDGNRFHDLTGSYGVNVFGYDFYKECIERGSARVRDLGPVRAGGDIVPYVWHGGRDAGGAAGALSHPAQSSGSILWRLSRLVGRRATRSR